MPRLKKLSGDNVVSILVGFGFQVHAQRGSHVKLRRALPGKNAEVLTVPRHTELDIGTLHAIFKQACRFVAEDELRKRFYTD
jgi:predicted RNA binding protein YcfA (HicA-like mRNA interferase family)